MYKKDGSRFSSSIHILAFHSYFNIMNELIIPLHAKACYIVINNYELFSKSYSKKNRLQIYARTRKKMSCYFHMLLQFIIAILANNLG